MPASSTLQLQRAWQAGRGAAGDAPGRGTFVRYDHTAAVGVLTREAAKAGLLAIGEDLGGVEPWIREYLEAHGILGTSMLWFERRDDGTPRPPGEWRHGGPGHRRHARLAPAAALLTGEHVTVRAMLGLLTPVPRRTSGPTPKRTWLPGVPPSPVKAS